MGQVVSSLFNVKIDFFSGEAAEDIDLVNKDSRRRNSLAFYIATYNKYEGEEFNKLVEDVKVDQTQNSKKKIDPNDKKPKSKYTKLADSICEGNMKELRNQIIVNIKNINRKYKDPHADNTLLHMICREGYLSMLRFLSAPENYTDAEDIVVDYSPLNNRKRTPLLLCFTPPTATYCGIANGVNCDGSPNAVRPDGIEVASDWIKPGGPKARERCIEMLLRQGANANDKDYHDFTPLHYASMWGWTSTAKLLLEFGANINVATIVGRTPLMYAVEFMNGAMVETLAFAPTVFLDAADSDGFTALIIAVEIGEEVVDIIRVLLEAGADPNAMTHRRKTPLMLACSAQSVVLVNLLFDFNVQREGTALALLEGDAALVIKKRIDEEERLAKLEAAELEKSTKLKAIGGAEGGSTDSLGYSNKSPWGMWVEYNDKRGGGSFYYNLVTRKSQKEKPSDFKPRPGKLVKDATFGMSFYH